MIRKKPLTKEGALLRMADLCARGEHCSSEIREKLRKLMISASDANGIIDYLEENRYIDNLRFAKSFARDMEDSLTLIFIKILRERKDLFLRMQNDKP